MPAPEAYRNLGNSGIMFVMVKSCSDKPDEAWTWLNEVFDTKTPRVELEKKLQEPGIVGSVNLLNQRRFSNEDSQLQRLKLQEGNSSQG